MIDKIINYIQGCCKKNEEGKRKRKGVVCVGILLFALKLFGETIYKISKYIHYVFGEKGLKLKKILILIVLFTTIFISYKLYKYIINYIS